MMHADRTNRTALIVLGLVLLAAGVGGLLASTGAFDSSLKHEPLFANFISRYIGRHGWWIWPCVAVVCLMLVLLCVRWLLVLVVSTDRAGDLTAHGSTRNGATTVRPGALTDALTTEIATYHGVDNARARLLGDAEDPDLVVHVTTAQSADLGELRRRIEGEALAHARQALDKPDLPIRLDLDVSRLTPERVR